MGRLFFSGQQGLKKFAVTPSHEPTKKNRRQLLLIITSFPSFPNPYFWMSDGLSHVVLNAPSVGAFDQALAFYCSVGFQIVTDTQDREESIMGKLAWLSMFSDGDNRDLTIRLKLNPATSPKEIISSDIDYTLEDIVLVIATSNLQV